MQTVPFHTKFLLASQRRQLEHAQSKRVNKSFGTRLIPMLAMKRVSFDSHNGQTKVIAHPPLPHATSLPADQFFSASGEARRKNHCSECKSFSHKTASRTTNKDFDLPRILKIVKSSDSFSAPDWPHICQNQGAEAGNLAASL